MRNSAHASIRSATIAMLLFWLYPDLAASLTRRIHRCSRYVAEKRVDAARKIEVVVNLLNSRSMAKAFKELQCADQSLHRVRGVQ